MSKQFAKLFEHDGDQVVVMKENHDDTGAPCLSFVCDIGWARVSPKIQFKDTDSGLKSRDEAFDKCDEETAFGMREKMVDQFAHMDPDADTSTSSNWKDAAEIPAKAPRKRRKP